VTAGFEQHLAEYRDLRRRLEENVLGLATSIDGRRFEFQASLYATGLGPGSYVMLEHDSGERLGQVLSVGMTHLDAAEVGWDSGDGPAIKGRLIARAATGTGTILKGDGAAFHDAAVRPATPEEVGAWLAETAPRRATLPVGELTLAPGVPFALDAGGFDRHTFFCGQSGSGKTYSLGVVLEQLLLETGLRIVILDPNSDFARLGSVRDGVDEATAARWRALAPGIDVRGGAGERRLHLRVRELDPYAQAAALRLDPIADRAEYAEFAALLEEEGQQLDSLDDLVGSDRPEAHALGLRIRNLGVDGWAVWSRGDEGSAIDALSDPGIRCLVLDIGSLNTREEQGLVAESVLATLWERRAERRPVLIVIDEAHNVCPAEPGNALAALATEHAVRIAAEGRKFGLYLLVCTQRPQKVPENVISQCDNLVLMRMASAADLAHVGDVLSYVPGDLLAKSTTFRLGEALVAGKLASHPALIRFGRRVAEEGGADVDAAWAAPVSA
jgi:DNA helicase HerA-like ATPase